MISDERKQALIEGAFYQAESLDDLRWLNSVFAHILHALPLKAQFQLSGVLERRVSEFEEGIVADAKGGIQMGHGTGNAEITEAAESSGEALRADPARDERPAAPELSGDRGHEGTGAVGDG